MAAAGEGETAGYSGTPLARKLGLADGQSVLFLDLPDSLGWLATARGFASVRLAGWNEPDAGPRDVIVAFTRSRAMLDAGVPALIATMTRDGALWVCWPKKASRVATDISENVVREIALPLGLVDVKVAAVDAVWSGLKLVIRRELRR